MSVDRLAKALRGQAEACAGLSSPFMAQLCRVLADRLEPGTALTDRLFGWEGDLSPRAESVPLRLCGALHALRLKGHAGLAKVYPPNAASDADLWAAVGGALQTEAAFVDAWIDSAPQTNEVRRSAVLIATAHWLCARHPMPLVLSELGASGGLNLMFDRFALTVGEMVLGPEDPALVLRPDWSGPVPQAAIVEVAAREGVDLNPLDPRNPDDVLRLRAYLWPDQPQRLSLTDAAIATAGPPVIKGDAIDWLEKRLAAPFHGRLHLIYTTIAWQYFAAAAQSRGKAMIEAAGAVATQDSPLAWLGMENDGGVGGPGAAVSLRLWPGDHSINLGRADFHGRWVRWDVADEGVE